jgi:hypothetical protein
MQAGPCTTDSPKQSALRSHTPAASEQPGLASRRLDPVGPRTGAVKLKLEFQMLSNQDSTHTPLGDDRAYGPMQYRAFRKRAALRGFYPSIRARASQSNASIAPPHRRAVRPDGDENVRPGVNSMARLGLTANLLQRFMACLDAVNAVRYRACKAGGQLA